MDMDSLTVWNKGEWRQKLFTHKECGGGGGGVSNKYSENYELVSGDASETKKFQKSSSDDDCETDCEGEWRLEKNKIQDPTLHTGLPLCGCGNHVRCGPSEMALLKLEWD